MNAAQRRERFHEMHQREKLFLLPNPWDVGSALILEELGFEALATTSSGFANTLGLDDGDASLDQLVDHVAAITAVVDIPLNVDAERCFAESAEGIAGTVVRLADAGAAGFSIEDWDPGAGTIDSLPAATDRVAAAVAAAQGSAMVVTARAENHIRGVDDLEDTITRLIAYRDAGAHCIYAPGLRDRDHIARVVREVGAPTNVLARPDGPSIPELAELGVRRVSTGGALAHAAYGSLITNATEMLGDGTSSYAAASPSGSDIARRLRR